MVLSPLALTQDKVQVKIEKAERVYYPRQQVDTGKTYTYLSVATVDSRTVFAATPEYQTIKRKGLTKDSAEYSILKKRASDRFRAAIQRTASAQGYDLIAEKGAISVVSGSANDATQEVVNNLQ